MKPAVVIIDYQLGNLFSVKQACEWLGHRAIISSDPETLLSADFAILPGVGAFADAMKNLQSIGFQDAILQFIKSGKPFMGVCLGLQLLFDWSSEFGRTEGLGIIPGSIEKFEVQNQGGHIYKVPQIQWNCIHEPFSKVWENTALQSCKSGEYMYFVHSYYAVPSDNKYLLSNTIFGNKMYCSSVLKDNVFATQFHPEKSGLQGVNIYKDWFKIHCK